jgi:transcriptional regulator with XRE-family HTH domain
MRKSNPALSESAAPVARIIHALLEERGLHHVEVSLSAGLGSGYLRDLFRGKSKKPSHEDLAKVADVLGVGIAALSEESSASIDKDGGDKPDAEEAIALLKLWGLLSDEGQDLALGMIAKMIIKHPRR